MPRLMPTICLSVADASAYAHYLSLCCRCLGLCPLCVQYIRPWSKRIHQFWGRSLAGLPYQNSYFHHLNLLETCSYVLINVISIMTCLCMYCNTQTWSKRIGLSLQCLHCTSGLKDFLFIKLLLEREHEMLEE